MKNKSGEHAAVQGLSAFDLTYALNLAIACLISYWITTALMWLLS